MSVCYKLLNWFGFTGTFKYFFASRAGHVGCPVDCNYVKLIDVPEMEYYAKDNIGEVSSHLFFFSMGICIAPTQPFRLDLGAES
jgi:hypothetical protein